MIKRYSFALLFFCYLLLLTVPTAAQDRVADPQEVNILLKNNVQELYFSIKSDDTLIGYSAYKVQRTMQLAGESFIKFQSLSRLKTGMGSIEDLYFQSEFSLSRQSLAPAYLQMKQTSARGDIFSETIFSSGVIAQKTASGKDQSSAIIPVTQSCNLLVNNLWGRLDTFVEHYLVMIILCRSGMTQIPVFDPILKTTGTIEIVPGKEERIEVGGTAYSCRHYTIKDFYGIPLMSAWYEPKVGRIIKMKELGGTLIFELSSRKVSVELEKSKGLDFMSSRAVPSPIYFTEPEKINRISLEGSLLGRGFQSLSHKVQGYEQQFNGTSTEFEASGTFEVKTSKPVIDKPNPFPPKNVPEDVAPYLKAQPGVESENEILKNKAMEITWKSRDSFTAASRINKWVKDNIKSGIALPAASFSFINGIGNSESRSLLVAAMCRSVGIPCRTAGGIAFKDGDFAPHYWVEAYLDANGWTPFDPESMTEGGGLDALRIYLWEFGDLTSTRIASIDFNPKPPQSVSYYNKDLTWAVGEERTYEIKKGETIIGREIAAIEDIMIEDGKESYIFASTSTLDIGGNTFKADGKLTISPNVLPREFLFKSEMDATQQVQHFKFEKGFITQIFDGTDRKRDIPYSRGTYLIDQRFLSQWALVVGQMPRPQLGKKYNFTVFVPEDLKTRDIELEAKNFEKIEAGEKEYDVFKCESKKGMVFYIDSTGKVVRIALPPQELEIDLVKTEFKLKNQ